MPMAELRVGGVAAERRRIALGRAPLLEREPPEAVHGEPLHTLPALREFVALLGARGRRVEVQTVPDDAATIVPRDRAFREARRLLWLAEGSTKDAHMRQLVEQWWASTEDGANGIALPVASQFVGIVTWEPPQAGARR